ncbi:MAG: DUF1802 family protein [Planctomycetes bacterium]|nr:DUF1802 family protein [Planctomycetota bacterium]
MKPENNMAYKEWASVEEALARGMFAMSLRKGGIHEKRGEFTVEQREYFLFPTHVHQRETDLVPEVLPFLEATKKEPAAEGADKIPIRHYAVVEEAVFVEDLKLAHALAGLHPFTPAAVDMRFNYKKPGIWAIVERLYRLPQTLVIDDNRLYAGCRSWVPLEKPLETAGAKPVLEESVFEDRARKIREILGIKKG